MLLFLTLALVGGARLDEDAELRALLEVIEVQGDGREVVGLRELLAALTAGTPIEFALTPDAEDAARVPLRVPAGAARTIPAQLERALASRSFRPTWRVAHGRLLVLTPERERALRADEAERARVAAELEQWLALRPARAEPLGRFGARVAAVWGHPVEVDAALVGAVDLVLPAATPARAWLTAAAEQAGGALAVRARGALLTTPERAARIGRGRVADDLLASELRRRVLPTPLGEDGEPWALADVVERLAREVDLDWPAELVVQDSYWIFGSGSELTLEQWLHALTRIAGRSSVDERLVMPRWRIREGRVEVHDGLWDGALDLSDGHDD